MTLEVTEEAADYIAERGYDAEYGARPLKRAIQRLVENPLSSALLRGQFRAGDVIRVTVRDGELAFVQADADAGDAGNVSAREVDETGKAAAAG
jgi:ATP-dependent Clp protease ATP-binding subunit ClpC